MKLNALAKTTIRKNKRLGRGYGSGKGGHTVGRGTKGQGARGTIAAWFEGGQLPMVRRFPFIRGKSRFNSLKKEVLPINLEQLNKLPAQTEVTYKSLYEFGLISKSDLNTKTVKLLSGKKLSVPLTIKIPVSKRAEAMIVKAGGKVDREQSV